MYPNALMPYATGPPPYDGKRWRPDLQRTAGCGEYPMEVLDLGARLRERQSWAELIIDAYNQDSNPRRDKSGMGYSNVVSDGAVVEESRALPKNYPMDAAVWRRRGELLKNATDLLRAARQALARRVGAWRRAPAGARLDAHQAA
eukprot:11107336-Alexandrium_andersonii.AAC.1